MNILCVSTDHDLPEAEMLCRLHRSGISITSVIEPGSQHIARFEEAGIEVFPLKITGKIDIAAVRQIRALIQAKNIDIVQAFSKKALCASNLAVSFLPVSVIGYRGIVGNLSRFDPGTWISFLHPRVSKIACVCDAVQRYMAGLCFNPSKAIRIYKGHDVSWYEALPTGDLSEFKIPAGAQVLCCTANMRPRKGVQVLIDAVEEINKAPGLDVHVLLIGSAESNKLSIPESLRSSVHFAGFRRDAVSLVKACTLFVMPSLRREGLPKAVIEAMSVGVVPVVTTSGGMPEIVEDMVSGRVVCPGDVGELANAIRELLVDSDVRQRLSQGAVARIREHFSIQDTIQQYTRLYEALLEKR